MRKIIIVLISLFSLLNVNVAFGQQARQLSNEIRSTKDNIQKKNLLKKLWSIKPKSQTEVEDLIDIAETAKDNDEKKAALGALQNVNEENRQQLTSSYIKALDSKDKDIRIYTMIGIGKMRAKEAAPKIREIVKGFGKSEYLAYKAMEKINPQKAVEMISEACTAAQTLGDIKDEEAIPILVDKYEELEGNAMIGLAKIGKKALPSLIELAKRESIYGQDAHARKAIIMIKDTDAKQDLINIVKNETDRDIRSRALNALHYNMFDDDLLQLAQDLYKKEGNTIFLTVMQNKKGLPFLINLLKNDKNPDARESAVVFIERINDLSAIPALEEALKDRNRNIRELAAGALKKLTGKDYEWKK